MSTAPAALDDYLLDLLAGDAPAAAPRAIAAADEAARTAPVAIRAVAYDDAALDAIPAVAEGVAMESRASGVLTAAVVAHAVDALLAEFDSEFPEQAERVAHAASPALDHTDALLAEFDSEFPEQVENVAHAATPAFDHTDALLAEFDSEFPEQVENVAHAATPAFDHTDALLAEFDSEFPEHTDAVVAQLIDATADLLAEFDAEFPAHDAAGADAVFAAAVAEERAADAHPVSLGMHAVSDLARAPEPILVPMPASMPAYARPVYEMLQKQLNDPNERAQSPHGDRRRAADRSSRWLRMRCDEQHYALELLKVQEVVLPATLLPLRGAARHMLGVMNLRGQVVPVIDLGLYLDRDAIVGDSQTRIVVLEEQGEIIGLRVSAVEDVTTLTDQQIEPPDNTRMCRITHPLFRGVARLTGRTVILLDASELLG